MPGLKTIYGRDGVPITDVKSSAVYSSLRNGIGEAVINIAIDSVKCRREVLEYGNFLLIKHGSLADWVGIIDTPRVWHNGYVEVHAFEVPYILNYRITPLNAELTGTPGDKFIKLIQYANNAEDTLIRRGEVTTAGQSATETLSDTVYAHLKTVQKNSGHDWICTPNVDASGKLTIVMDWLEKAGVDTDLELWQGFNILYGDTPLEESGELINNIEALTDIQGGVTTGMVYEDAPTRQQIGLRAARKAFSGATDAGALLTNATNAVKEQKDPSLSTPLTVVNRGSTFANIRIGNTARYKYTNVGFSSGTQMLSIDGYRSDEINGTCELFAGKVT